MKISSLLLLFVLNSCVLFGQSNRYDTIRYARQHYQKRVSDFNKEPVRWGRTILLGNSITEFADWKELFQDTTVINRGIAADNTFGILERLNEIISRKPSRVFVEAGINDISQNIPLNVIAKNLFTIAARLKQEYPRIQIYIYSVLPTNHHAAKEYPDAVNKNHIVRSLNEQLRKGAKENQFTYIDLTEIFSDNQGNLREDLADHDGLHLNAAGYKAWVSLLRANHFIN